jgi:hypothetical protein
MMGRLKSDQGQLFYEFRLGNAVPEDHMVRKIDAALDLSWLRSELTPHYSSIGRPSIDPELMIRLNAYCTIFESATAYRSPCARVENPVGRSLWRPWNALTTGRTFLTSHFPEYFEQVSYDLI